MVIVFHYKPPAEGQEMLKPRGNLPADKENKTSERLSRYPDNRIDYFHCIKGDHSEAIN